MRRKLAAGNWKMNGTGDDLVEISALAKSVPSSSADVLICPPATLTHRMAQAAKGTAIKIGGQDCHNASSGAHTGDVSALMLMDAGATYVILGHSERRETCGETSAEVSAKAKTAIETGLCAIVCIGETLSERNKGKTLDVIGTQLAESVPDKEVSDATLVVAYEPVWAIGTGLTPTLEQIAEVHAFIRSELVERFGSETGNSISLLYGGSVKPGNATEIFGVADVDGALVGGASLKANDFGGIIAALT